MGVKLSEVERKLGLNDRLSFGLEWQTVAVSVPKFSLESSMNVKENLENLGLTHPFSSKADFSGITGRKELFISAHNSKSQT